MSKNLDKKSRERERERESSLKLFRLYKKSMNKSPKIIFGFVFLVALCLMVFSVSLFTLAIPEAHAENTFVFNSTLKLGMTSPEVKELQKFLNNNGFVISLSGAGSPNNETNYFGQKTKQAVILFQIANNLTTDGVVGSATRKYINQSENPNNQTNKDDQIPVPTTTELVRILKLTIPAMKGDDVKTLQIYLNSLGYDCGIVDGIFGLKTKQAVILFQISKGLTPDGFVGPMTRDYFNPSQIPTTPIPPTSPTIPSPPAFQLPIISGGGSSSPRIRAISNSTITGVTIPAQGEVPVSTLAGNSQYTATISWDGTPSVFLASTSYTATITITPKENYTLTGVTENFFTVAGATSINAVDSGVVTAVFPSTPQKQLSISLPTITTTKAYDGNTSAVVTAGTLAGVSSGETVTVSATATYDDKNVGTGKTITVVYTLGGADAGHYIKPADYTVTTGVITIIPLTISNPTLTTSKQYDRTTTAVVTAGSLIGKISGDDVTPLATATYDTPSVNTGKTITATYSLSGADAGNYTKPVDRVVYSGTIIPKQLTITNPTITKIKLYDQNTSAGLTLGTLSGVVGSEDVSISGVANYENENVATGKDITVVYSISGPESYNYTKPVNFEVNDGEITPIQLTIGNPTLTTTKEYDNNTSALVTAGTLSGVLSLDTVTVSLEADYDNDSVGTDKIITTVYTLSGADSGNYTKPVDYVVNTGEITPILINTPAIAGVTVPATDGTPVTTVTETDDYTGTVTWSGSPVTFANATVYTATITLTPKTGRTLTGVTENLFTVAGATSVTNPADSGVITAVFPTTLAYASTPSSITLAVGSTNPVSGVTNVSIPSNGGTDTTGVILGYTSGTADTIKFTVTDSGSAVSTITMNSSAYTSGADYTIVPTTSFLSVVVTTTETNRTTTTRTFTITSPILDSNGIAYGMVVGADSKIWLDRNLGATRVATSYSDTQSYGYLYQWGRPNDGHQITTSGTTATLSSSDTPGHSNFITNGTTPFDWRSPQSPNASTLWAGANGGTNNVCPAGFHVPTLAEWSTLVTAIGNFTTAGCVATSTCRETAFNSSLKIPVAGFRYYSSASLSNQGSTGYYWSSSVSGTSASSLYFSASSVNPANANYRASGFTVRCLKN